MGEDNGKNKNKQLQIMIAGWVGAVIGVITIVFLIRGLERGSFYYELMCSLFCCNCENAAMQGLCLSPIIGGIAGILGFIITIMVLRLLQTSRSNTKRKATE